MIDCDVLTKMTGKGLVGQGLLRFASRSYPA